jgi:hypothetical protein
MATVTLRPNGDAGPNDWLPMPGPTHYTAVDEAVLDKADYLEVVNATSDILDMETVAGIDVATQIDIHVYNYLTDNRDEMDAHLIIDGADLGRGSSEVGQTPEGEGVTSFTGVWSQAQIDSMKVKLFGYIEYGEYARAYQVWAVVTYTERAAQPWVAMF